MVRPFPAWGGISKINTVDNVMTIFTSPPMRERGEYRMQFIKTRSSSGVGSSLILKFDPISLRIYDKPEGEESQQAVSTQELLRSQLNNKKVKPKSDDGDSVENDEVEETPKPKRNALDLLNKVKQV